MFFLGQFVLIWFIGHGPVHATLLMDNLFLQHSAAQSMLIVPASGACPLLVGVALYLTPRLDVHPALQNVLEKTVAMVMI